jgi:hypothetical protein
MAHEVIQRWHVPCLAIDMARKIHQWLTALALVFTALSSAFAVPTLTIGDSRDLGLISKNQPADPSSSAGFMNILLDQPLNSGPTVIGANNYTRTGVGGISYPDAIYSGVEFGSNVTNIDLGSGYLYLLAKYDGQNWGSQVWYVGGLTGSITIPLNGNGTQFAVSHTYLYNPTSTSVPDGGMTAVMLGFSFCGLGLVGRFFGPRGLRR